MIEFSIDASPLREMLWITLLVDQLVVACCARVCRDLGETIVLAPDDHVGLLAWHLDAELAGTLAVPP